MSEERTNLAHLRALAEGATPGPWEPEPCEDGPDQAPCGPRSVPHFRGVVEKDGCPVCWIHPHANLRTVIKQDACCSSADARYIAAISPDVLLALLDRLERVEGALGRMLGTHDGVHAESCNCHGKGLDEDLDVDDTCDCGATETRTMARAALRCEP